MEQLFRDVSNAPISSSVTVKTFERRRRPPVALVDDEKDVQPESPAHSTSSDDDECDDSYDSSTSCDGDATGSDERRNESDSIAAELHRSSTGRHGGGRRRSTILAGAALPGHPACREAPASRSTWVQRLPRSRREALLVHLAHAARHFAEVDRFQLLEESPAVSSARRLQRRPCDAAAQECAPEEQQARVTTPRSPPTAGGHSASPVAAPTPSCGGSTLLAVTPTAGVPLTSSLHDGPGGSACASSVPAVAADATNSAGAPPLQPLRADTPDAPSRDSAVVAADAAQLIEQLEQLAVSSSAVAKKDTSALSATAQQQLETDALAQQQEHMSAQLAEAQAAMAAAALLTPLQQMLCACGQSVDEGCIPSIQEFLGAVADLEQVIKLGEGTYGEVFRSPTALGGCDAGAGVVFKFVPIEGANLVNGWPQKGAADLLAEAVIARALTGLADGEEPDGMATASRTAAFVRTYAVGVARGPFPASFVRAWHSWHEQRTSENDPIDSLPDEQLYAVFAMGDAGRDLESYRLAGFQQARAMMLQVALALAVAEDCLAFEHRDLHWGNVMLRPTTAPHVAAALRGSSLRVASEGIEVTLIDFTASRLQTPSCGVAFCNLEAEEGLFDGPKGKPQFETYRRMRKATRGDWAGSHPVTNVLWLRYLAELLLSPDKALPGATAEHKRALRGFIRRCGGYATAGEALWDELFQGLWAVVDGPGSGA